MDISKGSPDRFGFEWKKYHTILPIYEEQFLRWSQPLLKENWKGKSFLDVGCGMGRNSFWPLTYGALEGVSIDVDERSLSAAKKLCLKKFKNVTIRNLSAYEIDYKNKFDIVFSIGVIHHLEFPEIALKKMVESAKPNGQVLIWVYGKENNEWITKFLDPLRKLLFSRLPISIVHFLSFFPTVFLWFFLRLGLGKIEYFKLIRSFSFPHLRSIVFDQMLPEIANYWAREQVEELMEKSGLNDIQLTHVNQSSWSAVGTKFSNKESSSKQRSLI